jgi:thiol-disulfide isomerase/thioredoxin
MSYEVEINCKPIGEQMIPIKNVKNIRTGEDISINHKPGQVILIDFWATWCPPCQAPMAHNQEMLEHHGEKWGDSVRIIGISIDDTADVVAKHVDAKGWIKVEHYLRGSSSSSKDYGVQSVPHVTLVDTNGKLAFIGNPIKVDFEKSIDSLLSGGKVVMKSESSGAAAAEDSAKILAELVCFATEVGEKIKTNEELKFNGLIRDFVAFVSDSTYDINTNKMKTNCHNINVLVGPKVAVDGAKSEIEKMLSTFTLKKEWRI